MRLRAIRLRHVRQFGAAGAALEGIGDAVNVLAAPNEAGKSTLFDALRTALFFKASSKHRDVSSLVPDPAGGAPEIEVDLDLDGRALRLVKRFVSTPQALLVDLAAGTTVAAGDAVDDRLAASLGASKPGEGPAGLLWLQQGVGLGALADVRDAPASLRDVVAREVGDMAGGERVARLLERARAERLKLVTAAQARPRGDYEQAIARHDEAVAEFAVLEDRAQAAERALDRLARIETALAEADADRADADLDRELEAARRGLEAARLDQERRDARARDLAGARAVEAAAVRAEAELLAQQAAARADLERLAEARAQKEAATRTRAASEAELAAAVAERDAARAAREEADNVAEETRRQQAAGRAAAALAAAAARLEQARGAACERDAKAKARRLIAVTPAAVAELEAAIDLERQTAARLAARRPTVTVHYEGARGGRVRRDGAALEGGVEHPVLRPTELALDGIGRLVVDPGGLGEAAELEASLGAHAAAVRARLDALGVADLAEARLELREAEALDIACGELERTVRRLAPDGVDALGREVDALAAMAEAVDETGPPLDPDEALAAAAAARMRADAAERHWRERLEAAAPAREAVAVASTRIESLMERTDAARARLGAADAWAAAADAARAGREAAARATAAAGEALARAEAEDRDVEAAAATVQRLEQALDNAARRVEGLRLERAGLTGELRTAEAEAIGERLADARATVELRAGRVAAFRRQQAALDVLVEVLAATEAEARERFTAPVLAAMDPLLAQILPEAELELALDFAPRVLRRPGRSDGIARLSGGTREQIAVLARLAFARLLARHGRELPVVLDDALVFSDDARIERMFTALTMAAGDVQVLVLTCRERTFRRLGGTELRLVPWPASER